VVAGLSTGCTGTEEECMMLIFCAGAGRRNMQVARSMHLMGKYVPGPLFQELLADYRRFRAQRQAARRKAG
jgi:hypothetical protein